MSISTAYNGWTNYETWVTNLWLEEDDRTFGTVQEYLNNDMSAKDIADMFKTGLNALNPLLYCEPSVYQDMLQSALNHVNWHEIIEHYLECIQEVAEQDRITANSPN